MTGQTGAEPKLKAAVASSRFVASAIALLALVLTGAIAFLSGKRAGHVPPPFFHQLTFRRGTISSARFAPDGASVIYHGKWEEDQHGQLYAQRLDAMEARSLGLPAGTGLLAVGPGELAVQDDEDTLARVPLEGGGLRKVLGDVAFADWSADGARLAVAREVAGRQWIEFPIGNIVYETTAAGVVDLRVSPDGKRLAFWEQVIATDSRMAISVLDEAGRKATLSAGWDTLGGLAWSPDAKEVWFTASRAAAAPSLYAVRLAGQERLVLSIGAGLRLQDVSRDGRVLLSETELRGEVRGAPDGVHERSFSWLDFTSLGDLSADGKNLLFSEWGQAGGPRAALYLRRLADPVPTRLGDGLAYGLSPDGAWALAGARVGMGQLHLVPTGVGETKVLAQGTLEAIMAASWFPDGRRIIVVGNEAGRPRRLFIQEVPDGLPRALTPEGVTLPRRGGRMTAASMVSPDGRFVAALIGEGPSPRYAFFPTAGGPGIPIPGLGENDEPLRWSGDGKSLFVWGGWRPALPVRIERLDLRTGSKQPWKELRPPDPAGVVGITSVILAPDGGAYFYDYPRVLSKLFMVEGLR